MGGLRDLFSRIGGQPATRGRPQCANCGITVDEEDEEDERTSVVGGAADGGTGISTYCCDGCAEGGPCTC